MMSPESLYIAELEFNRFEEIMNTKEVISKEEYDFCFVYDKDIREDTSYLGDGEYLNLRVYSEHDHEKRGEDDVNNMSVDKYWLNVRFENELGDINNL